MSTKGILLLFETVVSKDDHTGTSFVSNSHSGSPKQVSQMDGIPFVDTITPMVGKSYMSTLTVRKVSQGPLQDRSILCTVTPRDKHEKSIERSWQTITKKIKVVLDPLPYILPLPIKLRLTISL